MVCAEGMGRSPIGHALGKLSEKVGTFSLTKPFFFSMGIDSKNAGFQTLF